jgi:hypothetical protein
MKYAKVKKALWKRAQHVLSVINAVKSHLKSFEGTRGKHLLRLNSFDVNFYEEFIKYLTL